VERVFHFYDHLLVGLCVAGASSFAGVTASASLKFDHGFLMKDFFYHASFIDHKHHSSSLCDIITPIFCKRSGACDFADVSAMAMDRGSLKIDAFAKSRPGRHSGERGSPEELAQTGFPLPAFAGTGFAEVTEKGVF
jgi:hypothetical protein